MQVGRRETEREVRAGAERLQREFFPLADGGKSRKTLKVWKITPCPRGVLRSGLLLPSGD